VPLSGPGQPAQPGVVAGGGTDTDGINGGGDGAQPRVRRPVAAGRALAGGAAAAPIGGLPADPMREAREVPGRSADGSGAVRTGYTPSGTRIGRNDPCWCGSGQKYKKCHGA